jgi:hypothetical protein
LTRHAGGGRIVNDRGPAALDQAAQQGMPEVALISGRNTPLRPKLLGAITRPFAVVVNELFDVLLPRKPAEGEVLQHGVVQHNNARLGESSFVNRPMQAAVTHVVERDIASIDAIEIRRVNLDDVDVPGELAPQA